MSTLPTTTQVSAGGVAYRRSHGQVEVALILVGPQQRWQLPKGAINPKEETEEAALREVREETGLNTEIVDELDKIEYWFYASHNGHRIRFHKYVHFYLMHYTGGDVADHDHESLEARWFNIDEAVEQLTFESEKEIVRKARSIIHEMTPAKKQAPIQEQPLKGE
jgi:8-oxo-dGTP pyrophosphatase MutT (NUDIX family)